MEFEWDAGKDRRNLEKHGLSLQDAARVFDAEERCLEIYDAAHSDIEERFITIGPLGDRLVIVVWTERESCAVRLISARFATPGERALYHQHRGGTIHD
jgi:uncharacterized protein